MNFESLLSDATKAAWIQAGAAIVTFFATCINLLIIVRQMYNGEKALMANITPVLSLGHAQIQVREGSVPYLLFWVMNDTDALACNVVVNPSRVGTAVTVGNVRGEPGKAVEMMLFEYDYLPLHLRVVYTDILGNIMTAQWDVFPDSSCLPNGIAPATMKAHLRFRDFQR